MISLPMDINTFTKIKRDLKSNSEILTSTEASPTGGTFSTSQINLGYMFNSETNLLNITVLAKHGIAKFASEDTIKQHLQDMLKNL